MKEMKYIILLVFASSLYSETTKISNLPNNFYEKFEPTIL